MHRGLMCLLLSPALFLGACENRTSLAKHQVVALLRDPGSAKFRNIKTNESAVCGEVNGKNAFGAYSGFKRFVSAEGRIRLEMDVSTVTDASDATVSALQDNLTFWELWDKHCSA